MSGAFAGPIGVAAWAVLFAGLGFAAYTDVRTREAPDSVWLLMGLAGAGLGLVALYPSGSLALVSWLLLSVLVLQHFVPWDAPVERFREWLPGTVELVGYVAIGGFLVGEAYGVGIDGTGVPALALAAYAAVVLTRALFELGLLYGGADAKALIAAATLIPLAPMALLPVPENATRLAGVLPGPLALLMDAALLAAATPLVLAVRNLLRGEFSFPSGFVGYTIPVRELPDRFVWIRDPLFGTPTPEEEAVESADEDHALRVRQRAELEAKGVDRVWVTPQLPFLLFLALGAFMLLVLGNLIFDLIALA